MIRASSLEKKFAVSSCPVDVAIVGGGPAGTAAALTLLKHSALGVAVVEKSYDQPMRVGETVSPGLQPVLDYLGVWEPFVATGHLPSYGTSAAWGSAEVLSHHFIFTGQGNGWHLDRRRFDGMLAEEMVKRGGWLITEAVVTSCARDTADRWQLKVLRKNGKQFDLTARFIIDASGKRAVWAQRFGGRKQIRDRLMGVIGFYEFADRKICPQFTLVEACADGWWYAAPLPDHRLVIAFMSDTDLIRRCGVRFPKVWNALLASTDHIQKFLAEGMLISPLMMRPAYSCMLEPVAGPGWIAAGDAAAAFDPLSSMGIGHAVASGIHAARVAHDQLVASGKLMSEYMTNVARNFQRYLERRRQYYQIEQRWPDRPFWNRRHQPLPSD